MFDASRRPQRRLFCWALAVTAMAAGLGRPVAATPQTAPALTTVADTVYRADGTPAAGSLIITWPTFVTGGGSSVAAGSTNVTLGANGALSVALVPNVGANPPGVYYTVVYQLQPGEVRTEYWAVPTATSAVNLAAVRTTPGSGTAAQAASMQYVNTALAAKADDTSVVHLAGAETIGGAKTFATAPSVPTPQNTGDVANKAYVDTAVANVGAGNYLSTAGGTMTGSLTLSGNPTSPLQAAPKQYVDAGITSKADLVSGLVPAAELGAGTANSGSCLYGNGTWGPCGSGSGNVSTTPAATQAIAEPAGMVFTANRIGQKRMADQFNWKQNPTSPASLTPGPVTVTLKPCPQGFLNGINGSNSNHWIYVDSAVGDTQQPGEPVLITAESCPAGAASGTISFSVAYAHGAGYALESGTGGIKEASVDANQVRFDTVRGNNTWIEVTPNATTKIKAPLYWQTTMGRLVGSSLLECSVNSSCLNIGDTNSGGFANGNASTYTTNVVDGLWIRPDQAMTFFDVAPSSPASITAGASSATLTIPTCPGGFWPLIPNQILWLNGTSGGLVSTAYEAGAPGPGEFVHVTGGTCTPGATNGTITIVPATPGINAFYAHDAGYTLSNGATALIEDNSQGTILENIQTNGFVSSMGYGFVIQNDNNQSEEVRNVNIYGGLRCDADFCGATLFGPGPSGFNAGITHLYEGSNGTCAEWYDGNDLLIGPTVCQGFSNFAIFMSTKRGGSLQRAAIHSVHRERGGVSNSLAPYLGAADIIAQGYNIVVDGNGDGMNGFPTFQVAGNPGGQLQIYYLSIVDVTDGTKTVPIPLGQANVNNPNTNNVTVKWVSADALPGKTINYELYRLAPGAGSAGQVPYGGVCDGAGGDGTCLVASNINPATVCDIHGACAFTDTVGTPTAVTPYNGADGSTAGGYFPVQSFSPGGIVLSGGATYQGDPECLVVMGGPWLSGLASVVNNGAAPGACIPSGGSFNTVLTGFMNNNGGYAQFGLLFPDRTKGTDGGNWTGLKGRLNFIGGGTYPRDIATWRDSNPAKTMSSKLEYGSGVAGSNFGTVNRPQWDVGDIATGVENAGTGLYERVPANGVFDWYVGALPNNAGGTSSNWTEELSGAGHTFKTPVTINGNLTVTGTCTGCGGGAGSSAWSSLTSPTSNLNVNLGTYLTGMTMGDFGSTPSAGIYSITDTATSVGDTSTNFLVGTGVGSRHNSFTAQLNGFNQFQVCWQPGPQGESVIGSAVPCSSISQSPFAKFVAMSQTPAHTVERLYQKSNVATGTMLEMNNATAAGTGFNFWNACAGASATDTSCGTGTNVASLRGDGYLTASGGNFTAPVTLPITGSGSQCLHVSSAGVVSGTGSDCGAGGSLPSGAMGTPVTNSDGGTAYSTSPLYIDADKMPGTTADVQLNNANAYAITTGNGVIDARAMGGAQTIASEVSIGELRPPAVSAVTGTSPGAGTYKLSYTLTSPTATETSASMESTVTITGSQAIQVASPTYYGTATSYNVYMTPVGAAAVGTVNTSGATVTWVSGNQFTTGSSWVGNLFFIQQGNGILAPYTISSVTDATHLVVSSTIGTLTGANFSTGNWGELKCAAATNVAMGSSATLTAACSGAAVSTKNSTAAVEFWPPKSGIWTVTIADSTPLTSCGLKFFDQSSAVGNSAGEGRPWYLTNTSSTDVEALICTDNNAKSGQAAGYYKLTGLSAFNTGSGHVRSAAMLMRAFVDVSVFDDLHATAGTAIPALWAYSFGGGGAGTRFSGNFEANSIGEPVRLGGTGSGMGSVEYKDISAVHPGPSFPNIEIQSGATGIHFSGVTYTEGNGSNSCSDVVQLATVSNINGPVEFDMLQSGAYCSGTTAYMFNVPSTYFVNNLVAGPVSTGQYTNLFNYHPNTAANLTAVGTGTTHPGFIWDKNNAHAVLSNFQVAGTTTLNNLTASGTVMLPFTGSTSQCLHVSATGVVTGTGADCGAGSGSGTVNSGTASQVAMYSGNGAAVSGDAALTDNGSTLNYSGSGGIAAATGTFSGNLTVNGQLLVAGPWMVSSPIPASAMAASGSGTSTLGISNDGNFYISANGGAPQKVATGTSNPYSNLWQEDANDLGLYNGTVGQGFHVYGTYTSASSYERTGLGWDATDGLFVLKNEYSGSGSQRGIGFQIGNNVRWGIDTLSTLKPYTNNSFNVGSPAFAPQTIYAATSFDTLTQGRENFELCNDGASGTALNFLAKYNGANPACAVKAGTADTDGVIGIVSAGSGTSGSAVITYRGYVSCSFDGATTTGDFVVASTTNAGDCHDVGATRPTGVQVLGRAESTNAGAGTYAMRVGLESPVGAGVASIFGRTGIVTAASGDYSVGQVTGAAPIASPAFTGTPTAPTVGAGDNSTKVATTAYVRNEAQFAWTCPVAGATTSGVSYCNWTVPANITITQFDLALSTAPAGCSPYPTFQVWDGKAGVEVGSYSITTTSSGGNFYPVVTGSTNLAQGEYLRIKVTAGGSGCTTTPAGIVATVTYQMQN